MCLAWFKAQQVKNAVNRSGGRAKGGFGAPAPAPEVATDEIQQEAIACYRLFIKGAASLDRQLHEGKVVPRPRGRGAMMRE